jgi:hypothetical protein
MHFLLKGDARNVDSNVPKEHRGSWGTEVEEEPGPEISDATSGEFALPRNMSAVAITRSGNPRPASTRLSVETSARHYF